MITNLSISLNIIPTEEMMNEIPSTEKNCIVTASGKYSSFQEIIFTLKNKPISKIIGIDSRKCIQSLRTETIIGNSLGKEVFFMILALPTIAFMLPEIELENHCHGKRPITRYNE